MTKPTADSNSNIKSQIDATYRNNFAITTKFISQLSNALRGVSDEINQRLSKIQSKLQSTTKFEELVPVMEQVDVLLRKERAKIQRDLNEAHKTALQAAKQLQQLNTLPQAARLHVRELISEMEGPAYSVMHYLPCLSKLLALYQESIRAPQAADVHVHNAGIKEELLNLLSFIELAGSAEHKLKSIQQQLMGQVSSE